MVIDRVFIDLELNSIILFGRSLHNDSSRTRGGR